MLKQYVRQNNGIQVWYKGKEVMNKNSTGNFQLRFDCLNTNKITRSFVKSLFL